MEEKEELIYEFDSEEELMRALGIDPETKEGDYAEAYHHMKKIWDNVNIDRKFDNGMDQR